jgi:beta-phosphoglucomutase
MPEFSAILFDFDGTLLDSEPAHWASWAETLAPVGIQLEWDFYRKYCVGIDDRELVRRFSSRAAPAIAFDELWPLYAVKLDLFRRRVCQSPPFPHGLGEFLASLRELYRLAVVSSSARPEVEPLLVTAGLRGYFDAVVCAEDTRHHKPSAEPYLLAAAMLGAPSALVVEDSAAGIASGRAAGFEVVEVASPGAMPELLRTRLGIVNAPGRGT